MMLTIAIIIGWLLSGVFGGIWWLTRHDDFKTSDIPIAIVFACMGPITLSFYYLDWRDSRVKKEPKVLIKRRKP